MSATRTRESSISDPSGFSRDYLVHYYEIDRKRRLTLPALMRYFEDIATLNSEARGISLDRYHETGRVFLLLSWDISVRSWPPFNTTIRIETRPTAFRRFLANREYAVRGKNGTLLAEARSVWIFMDLGSRKPVRVPEEIAAAFGVPGESGNSFAMLEELPPITVQTRTLGLRVQSGDLDNNRHVNNVRYVEWALESLPEDFVRDHAVERAEVHYRKELKPGSEAELVSGIALEGGRTLSDHAVRSAGNEISRMRLTWREEGIVGRRG